jgi:small-conductance mechanosensitive channel
VTTTATTSTVTAAPPPDPGAPGLVTIDRVVSIFGRLRELIVVPEARVSLLAWGVLALLLAWLLARRAQRVAGWSTWVGPAVAVLRLIALVLLAALVLSFIPAWLAPSFFVALLAAAAAVGWSLREVLPDVFASIWIVVERRIRPGVFVRGEDLEGRIENVGIRVTRVLTGAGSVIAVPNREFMQRVWSDEASRWPLCRAVLTIEQPLSADAVRRALVEAVSTSARVPLNPELRVFRSSEDDRRWEIRCRVVSMADLEAFRSELPERFARYASTEASAVIRPSIVDGEA